MTNRGNLLLQRIDAVAMELTRTRSAEIVKPGPNH